MQNFLYTFVKIIRILAFHEPAYMYVISKLNLTKVRKIMQLFNM